MELTILSAQGLKSPSPFFYHHLQTFVTLTTIPLCSPSDGKGQWKYRTRVDYGGDTNPTWGDKFNLPIDTTFFSNRSSSIYLQLYTKGCFMAGQTKLGWCYIPATDIMDGLWPAGSVRHLTYQLRAADGSRGHGIINVTLRLESTCPAICDSVQPSGSNRTCLQVIGVPVAAYDVKDGCYFTV